MRSIGTTQAVGTLKCHQRTHVHARKCTYLSAHATPRHMNRWSAASAAWTTDTPFCQRKRMGKCSERFIARMEPELKNDLYYYHNNK